MMRLPMIGILCGGTLALAASAAAARDIQVEYRFEFPNAGVCDDAATGCQPWDASLATEGREHFPVVPVRVARILLDKDEVLAGVKLSLGTETRLDYRYRLAPEQRPISGAAAPYRHLERFAGGEYPASWHGEPRVTRFRGHRIVEVPIYPLRVLDAASAVYVESATLTVTTTPGGEYDGALTRSLARDGNEALERADNASSYKARIVPPEEEIGYLIIGPRALIGEGDSSPLAPLIRDKEDRQLLVKMAALEDVSARKDPGEIRDFIRERYKKDSIDFVLIIGNKSNFPWKYVKTGVNDASDPVPSDQYYACLDGDFSRPADLDWACEVSVGRVGARSRDEVAAWVEKTLALQAAASEKRNTNVLSFGEKLDARTLGDRVLDFLINGTERAPRTVGFPAAIKTTKLYETFRREVSATEFIRTLNDGDFHVVNHLGHANETYVFRTPAGKIPELRSRPAFYYSQGCYPNDPDHDNWTIQAVRMRSYGPAAMISNTRYGWYAPGSSDEGSSSMLHRAFWSMRFDKGVKHIGTMNHRAKEVVVAADRSALMRYTALESNLIGDPALDLGF